MATLQHQVEILGRSLQPAPSTPSIYQAPTTHTSTANRNVPNTQAYTRPNDTRDNTTGYPRLTDQGGVKGEQYTANAQPSRAVSRQQSRNSLLSNLTEDQTQNQYIAPSTEEFKEYKPDENVSYENLGEVAQESSDKPMEVENVQEYEGVEQNYTDGNYENYAEKQAAAEYQNEGYEQPAYTGEQYEHYDENQQYGDYPQQYVDPNAQYEGQYENYAADGTYQGDQVYDQSQHQEYTPQTEVPEAASQKYIPESQVSIQPSQDIEPNMRPESIRTVSPNDKLSSQS